jgi:CHAT domain-containing protein/tetratricopeptide (TPR) repeat protein
MHAAILLLTALTSGAAPPAALTPEQAKQAGIALALHRRAQQEWRKGMRAEATASLQKELDIVLIVFGEESAPAYAVSSWLADWEDQQGHWRRAAAHRGRLWKIQAGLYGEGHWLAADARWALRTAKSRVGWTEEQNRQWGRAAALHAQTSVLGQRGQITDAMRAAREAVRLRKSLVGEQHPKHISSLNELATLYQDAGDHETALALHRKALALSGEALGERHPLHAALLNNLAYAHWELGNPRAALPLFRKALDLHRQLYGERHPAYATCLHNLAHFYQDMADHRAALPLCQKALSIRMDVLGEGHASSAESLHNLASLYHRAGDHKLAMALYKQALAITARAQGKRHPNYARTLDGLGALHVSLRDYKSALACYRESLSIHEDAYGPKHPYSVQALNNLAAPYYYLGDFKSALALYEKALALDRELRGERHSYHAGALYNLAHLHLARGDHEKALPHAEKAVALTFARLRDAAAAQSDRQQFASIEALRYRLHSRLSLLDAGCYGHVLVWKGAVLMRQRQRRLFSALSAGPRTREAAEELQAVTRRIAALSASMRPAREELERLTRRQERLQVRLSGLSADAHSAFQAKPLTPEALAKALPAEAALVDYLFYVRSGFKSKDGRPRSERHLVAFVTRRGKPTARIDLGRSDKAEGLVRDWVASLARGKTATALGAEVKKQLWSPLEKHLAGASVVLISPDGGLGTAPFAALPGKKPDTYLIEDVAVAALPVPQMLPEVLKHHDGKTREKPSLLLVSDVNYDRATPGMGNAGRGAPLGARRSWSNLPATRKEADHIKARFQALFKDGAVTDLRKATATKARARAALARVRYAHLATHGFFTPGHTPDAAAEPMPGLFGPQGTTGWHPLLLSGLVLAGANKEPKEGEEDGILTALEVSEMQLPKLELVVLSACETGLGKAAAGEGLLGLQRAFAVAGARSVVASLWSVDDRATQALMAEFYARAWDEKSPLSKAEALRQAQLALLKGTIAGGKLRGLGKKGEKLPKGEVRLPPLYWAAFVLSGDWR